MQVRLKPLRHAAAVAALAAACTFAAPLAPATKPSEKVLRETVAVLASQGAAALEVEDKQASLDAFLDAFQLIRTDRQIPPTDPLRVQTMHGLAVAYYKAGRVDKAGEVFKANDTLDKVLANPAAAPRSLVINRAVVDMTQKFNVMRAIKTMKDYMAAHPDEVDETLLNMLGTALDTAANDDRFSKAALFEPTVKYYEQAVTKLEGTRPGKRRWGVDWVSSSEWKRLNSDRQEKLDDYNRAAKSLADARGDLRQAEDRVKQEAAKAKMGRSNSLSYAQGQVRDAEERVGRRQREANEKREVIPKYPWLTSLSLVSPEYGAMTAVAIAPPVTPPTIDRPTGGSGPKPAIKSKPPAETPVAVDPPAEPAAPAEPVAPAEPTPPPVAKVSRVTRYATAFPVAPDLLITSAAAVERAESVGLEDSQGNSFDGSVVRTDEKTGLALVRVQGKKFVFLNLAPSFNGGEDVRCTSFPTPAIFQPRAEVLAGKSQLIKADAASWSISVSANPRLGGAPVVNKGNELVGVAMASRETAASAVPAVKLEDVKSFLGADAPSVHCTNPDPSYVMMVTAVIAK